MGSPSLFMTTSCQSANVLLVFQVYATCSFGGVSGQLLRHEQQSSSCLCFRSRLLVFLPSCRFFGLSHHHLNLKHQELSLEPVRNIIQSRIIIILSQIFSLNPSDLNNTKARYMITPIWFSKNLQLVIYMIWKYLEQNEQSDYAAETSTFYSLFYLSLFP